MPLSISWPARFARQGARTAGARRGGRHRPDLPRARRRRRPDRRATRGCAGTSLVPALEDPAGARGKDFTVTHVRRGLVAAGLRRRRASRGSATCAPRSRAASRSPATSRWSGKPQKRAHRRPGVRALRPRARTRTSCATSPRDPPTSRCSTDLLARLRELEDGAAGPGRGARLRRRVARSSRCAPTRSAGRETALERADEPARRRSRALPGAYVQLPFGDPHLERRVYEGGGGERAPQTARRLARAGRGPRRVTRRDALRARRRRLPRRPAR